MNISTKHPNASSHLDGCESKHGNFRRLLKNKKFSFTALAAAGLMLASAPMTRAALMAYEGFNYASGNGNLTGQAGGFGWNGSWHNAVNGSSSVANSGLAAGANAPAGYDSHSAGKAAFTPNGTRTGRFLDTSAGGTFGLKSHLNGNGFIGVGTVYIGFMQQSSISNNNYYEFEFHRNDLNDGGRVAGIGCDSGGSSSVYLRSPAIGQNLIGPASTSVNFYIVRIDYSGNGNDTVSVYQNPTSATEPGTPTLLEANAGDMSFNGISFGAFVNGATVMHDELRVGESWNDVISPSVAGNGIWVGNGANNNWSTAANWSDGLVPTFTTSLNFTGANKLSNVNDLTNISVNNITFDAAAGAFTLSGNTLGMDSGIVFSGNPASPITQTVSMPIVGGGDITVDSPTNGNILLNGGVTSSFYLTKLSPGTLTLANTNAFAALSLDGGTNIITGDTAINGLNGGHKFYLADGDFVSASTGTLVISPGANLSVTGNFGDAGVIGRDSGTGIVIQNGGTFSYAPANQIYLFIGAANSSLTRSEYRMNGGVFDMNNKTLGVALGAGTSVTCSLNQSGGLITNVDTLDLGAIPVGPGHGIYRLTGGTISIGANGIKSDTGIYDIFLGGGTVTAQGSWSSSLKMNLTGTNGPVTFAPAGNVISLSGVLSGTGGLNVSGPGVLDLSGANTYTGDTTIGAGATLQLDNTGSSAGAIRIVNGGTLYLNFGGTFAVGSLYTNGVAVPVGSYNSGTLPGFVNGSGTLQVTSGISTGLWTGLGANGNWSTAGNWDNNAVPIFPHALTFAGTGHLVNNNDLSSITISSFTFDAAAGAFTLNGNDVTLNGPIAFNGTPAAPVTQTINLNLALALDETVDVPTNATVALNGNISSNSKLTKTGAGNLTLGGPNTSFTSLIVDGGTNVIASPTVISGLDDSSRFLIGDSGTVGTLVIQPSGSLFVTGNFGDAGVVGRDGGSGTIIQNGGTFSFAPGNHGILFLGASGNAGTKAEYDMNGGWFDMNNYNLNVGFGATATAAITGLVNQAGGVITNVGQLDLGPFNSGPGRGIYKLTGGSIYIGGNGIVSDSHLYDIFLGGGTVGAYSSWSSPLNMTLTGTNGSVTFDTQGNNIALLGNLSGPGGLIVTGGGNLDLAGTNSFLGDMTVSLGTLQIDQTGSSVGAIRLASGTMLNLTFSGNYIVGALYTNGVAVPNGIYNNANLSSFISGSGNVQVVGNVSSGLWTGSGANNNWSTAANWDHNAVPIFPIALTFAGNNRLANNNDLSGIAANSITFASTAGAFVLGGNPLGLNGNIGFNGNPAAPVTETINVDLTINGNETIDTPANGNIKLGGTVTSTGGLVKSSAGTLTLAGNSTFSSTGLDAGTTVITGNVTITGLNNGSKFYVGDGDTFPNTIATVVLQPGSSLTVNGNFGDAGVFGRDTGSSLFIQNGGTFTFNLNQQYLFLGATSYPGTHSEYDMNGGLFDMSGKTLGLALADRGVSSSAVLNQSGGVITNCGNLWFSTFFASGFGAYNLTGGAIYIGSGGINTSGGYQVNLGGGTIAAQANWSSSLNMTLTGTNGAVTFNPAGNFITLNGALSGTGGLTVTGGGTLELGNANTFTGLATVNNGILKLDNKAGLAGGLRLASGTTANLNFTGTNAVPSLSTNNVALAAGIYNAGNLPGYLTGSGNLQVVGSGSGPQVGVTVSAGLLKITWPSANLGWALQVNTNSLTSSASWVDVPGTRSVTSTNIAINPTTRSAFYRLRP